MEAIILSKEQTKFLLLKDFVFKLDENFDSIIKGIGKDLNNYQHLVHLQKKNVTSQVGQTISATYLQLLKSFVNPNQAAEMLNTGCKNHKMLYDYWLNMDYIEYELYIYSEGSRIFNFSYKILIDSFGYSIPILNRAYDYATLPNNQDYDSLLEMFKKKLSSSGYN